MSHYRRWFTPWARAAMHTAGIDPEDIRARTPAGWTMFGNGTRAIGPFNFELRNSATGERYARSAMRWPDVPAAIEYLLALPKAQDDLEAQLAASLAARGIL